MEEKGNQHGRYPFGKRSDDDRRRMRFASEHFLTLQTVIEEAAEEEAAIAEKVRQDQEQGERAKGSRSRQRYTNRFAPAPRAILEEQREYLRSRQQRQKEFEEQRDEKIRLSALNYGIEFDELGRRPVILPPLEQFNIWANAVLVPEGRKIMRRPPDAPELEKIPTVSKRQLEPNKPYCPGGPQRILTDEEKEERAKANRIIFVDRERGIRVDREGEKESTWTDHEIKMRSLFVAYWIMYSDPAYGLKKKKKNKKKRQERRNLSAQPLLTSSSSETSNSASEGEGES